MPLAPGRPADPAPEPQPRTRDAKGIPIIPGLDDSGAIFFDECWTKIQQMPFDDACSVSNGFRELIQHHPSLRPEAMALEVLYAQYCIINKLYGFSAQATGARRLLGNRIQAVCGLPLPKACVELAAVGELIRGDEVFLRESLAISALIAAWESLRSNMVSERIDCI